MRFYFSQDTDNDALKNVLKANAEKPVKMMVYSSKTGKTRGSNTCLFIFQMLVHIKNEFLIRFKFLI